MCISFEYSNIFEIRISYANIRIPISTFVDIPTSNGVQEYKNLTQVSGMDRQICPDGHFGITRLMPNCDPRGRFVYPYLTCLIDFFSCMPSCGETCIMKTCPCNIQIYFQL